MATGTSVSSAAYGIINDAMVDAGLLQEGQKANSEQLATNLRRLNDILNLWQTQGLKLFLQQEVPFDMVAGQGVYNFGPIAPAGTGTGFGVVMPKPTRVLQGYVISASGSGQQIYINIPIVLPLPPISVGDSVNFVGPGSSVTGITMGVFPGAKSSSSLGSITVNVRLNSPLPWSITQINGNIGSYQLFNTTVFGVFTTLGSVSGGEGVRRPLTVLSVDEWERLGQVAGNLGTVNSYMVRKGVNSLEVNLWPIPDATDAVNTCVLLFQLQTTNPVALTDSVSLPQEWRIALRWALAEDIATGQPQAIVDRCARNAETYRLKLEDWDVEDAPTMFAVDMRMNQGYGRFK